MAEPTFAEKMVAKLEAQILALPPTDAVSIDGTSAKIDREKLEAMRAHYARIVAREKGTIQRVWHATLNAGNL